MLMAVWTMAVAPKGIGPYIRQHFLDTTFRGLYHANGFDLALLIPYFVILIQRPCADPQPGSTQKLSPDSIHPEPRETTRTDSTSPC